MGVSGFVGGTIIAFNSDLRVSSLAKSFSSRFSSWTVTSGDAEEEPKVFTLEIVLAALRTSRFIRVSMGEVEEALKLGMDWEVSAAALAG